MVCLWWAIAGACAGICHVYTAWPVYYFVQPVLVLFLVLIVFHFYNTALAVFFYVCLIFTRTLVYESVFFIL